MLIWKVLQTLYSDKIMECTIRKCPPSRRDDIDMLCLRYRRKSREEVAFREITRGSEEDEECMRHNMR